MQASASDMVPWPRKRKRAPEDTDTRAAKRPRWPTVTPHAPPWCNPRTWMSASALTAQHLQHMPFTVSVAWHEDTACYSMVETEATNYLVAACRFPVLMRRIETPVHFYKGYVYTIDGRHCAWPLVCAHCSAGTEANVHMRGPCHNRVVRCVRRPIPGYDECQRLLNAVRDLKTCWRHKPRGSTLRRLHIIDACIASTQQQHCHWRQLTTILGVRNNLAWLQRKCLEHAKRIPPLDPTRTERVVPVVPDAAERVQQHLATIREQQLQYEFWAQFGINQTPLPPPPCMCK